MSIENLIWSMAKVIQSEFFDSDSTTPTPKNLTPASDPDPVLTKNVELQFEKLNKPQKSLLHSSDNIY